MNSNHTPRVPPQLRNDLFRFVKLRHSSKCPFEKDWQNNPYSFRTISSWVEEGNNYGILGGHGDLLIIDTDTPQLTDFVKARFPPTFTVKSPRKGYHFYFFCKGLAKKIVLSKDGEHHGEIMSFGSQVVGPGSIHPDTKTEYVVAQDSEIAGVSLEMVSVTLAQYIKSETNKQEVEENDEEIERDDIKITDVLTVKKVEMTLVGNELVGAHPMHGSTTGKNFHVNPEKNVWHCFRCNTGGGPISLIAVLEGIIECDEVKVGALKGEKFLRVAELAEKIYGYKRKNETTDIPKKFFNDIWNAELFVTNHGSIIRNCDQLGGWHIWNQKVWEKDETHNIIALARNTVDNLYTILPRIDGKKRRKLFLQHIRCSGNEGKLRAMVNIAKSSEGISILSDVLDYNRFFINCQNGVFDLENDLLLPHHPGLLLTKICNASYDPESKCPNWNEFLNTIFQGDKSLIDFIQKALGYCLTADVSRQMFFILYGNGSNGKSTFVDTVLKILGDYAVITPTSTLTLKREGEIPNDVARLKGARFVLASELAKSKTLDEGLIKQFTSLEPLTARFLRQEFFTFNPTGKFFLSTNHKPNIKGTDDGIWRRIKLIPFNYKFTESMKINDFVERCLVPERNGILTWMITGYQKLKKEGLQEPEIVQYATKNYKSSEDSIASYLDEFCVQISDVKILVLNLYEHFRSKDEHFVSKKDFNEYLERRGFTREKGTAGIFKGRYFWRGIGLRADSDKEVD